MSGARRANCGGTTAPPHCCSPPTGSASPRAARRGLARLGHRWGSHARLSTRTWPFLDCDPLPGILPDGRQARPGSPLYPAPLDSPQGPLAEEEVEEDED